MALMEILQQSLLNTTTQITTTANNGAGTFQYSFDRNIRLGYSTVGYSSSTVAGFSIVFSQTTPVSHILIQNHNLRQFRAYYNSVTANSLAVVAGNSATSTYLSFATVSVSNIELEMELQMSSGAVQADIEKTFGEIIVANRQLVFARNPSVQDWTPSFKRKQLIHEMPDGGIKAYQIRDKFQTKLKWSFITETFRNDLYTIYSSAAAFYFVPFPTTSAWDGQAYEVLWPGDFDFKHGDNSKSQGFGGSVLFRETTGG